MEQEIEKLKLENEQLKATNDELVNNFEDEIAAVRSLCKKSKVKPFTSIKLNTNLINYYLVMVFNMGNGIIDGVDYSTENWIDDQDHSKGSHGKIYNFNYIPSDMIILNKLATYGLGMFVTRYSDVNTLIEKEELSNPGVYIYRRQGYANGVDPIYTLIAPYTVVR